MRRDEFSRLGNAGLRAIGQSSGAGGSEPQGGATRNGPAVRMAAARVRGTVPALPFGSRGKTRRALFCGAALVSTITLGGCGTGEALAPVTIPNPPAAVAVDQVPSPSPRVTRVPESFALEDYYRRIEAMQVGRGLLRRTQEERNRRSMPDN